MILTFAMVILGLVTAQRIGELFLAKRNTERLIARGAVEQSGQHYPFIVALHAAWLLGLWVLAWNANVNLIWLAAFIVLQALRVWVIVSLGERWTTRIIVLPGAARITRGPYRFFSHPNYLVVAAEIVVLPMVFGLWVFALIFFVLNAVILFVRINAEGRALDQAEKRPDSLQARSSP